MAPFVCFEKMKLYHFPAHLFCVFNKASDQMLLDTTNENRRRVRSVTNHENEFGVFSDVSRDQII